MTYVTHCWTNSATLQCVSETRCVSLPPTPDILQHAVYANELDVEECGDVYTALAELKQVQ